MEATWSAPSAERIKYLSDDELRAFFDVIRANPKDRARKRDLAMFSLALAYGLRETEAITLRLEHINLPEHQLYIQRLKRRGKGGRWYDISEGNLRVLKSWLKERAKYTNARSNPWLFISQMSGSGHLSADRLYGAFKRYAAAAGIPGMYPHCLRFTCGVRLAKAGFSAFQIQSRLGHASVLSSAVYVQLGHPDRIEQDRRADEALRVL